MLTWEKISGSPHFSVLQVMESWAEPGNEATDNVYVLQVTGKIYGSCMVVAALVLIKFLESVFLTYSHLHTEIL